MGHVKIAQTYQNFDGLARSFFELGMSADTSPLVGNKEL
jgi:hypothetical protein